MVERFGGLVCNGPDREGPVYENVRAEDCDGILWDAKGLWAEEIELPP